MDLDKFLKESKESVKDDESKPWRSAALKPKPATPKPAPPKPVKLPPVTATDAWGQAGKIEKRNKAFAPYRKILNPEEK